MNNVFLLYTNTKFSAKPRTFWYIYSCFCSYWLICVWKRFLSHMSMHHLDVWIRWKCYSCWNVDCIVIQIGSNHVQLWRCKLAELVLLAAINYLMVCHKTFSPLTQILLTLMIPWLLLTGPSNPPVTFLLNQCLWCVFLCQKYNFLIALTHWLIIGRDMQLFEYVILAL